MERLRVLLARRRARSRLREWQRRERYGRALGLLTLLLDGQGLTPEERERIRRRVWEEIQK